MRGPREGLRHSEPLDWFARFTPTVSPNGILSFFIQKERALPHS